MPVAYANKDQMKVWKSTVKPEKDRGQTPYESVMFTIKETENGIVAHLSASDGYQLMRRNIQPDNEAKAEAPLNIAIPREAMEKAEKVMGNKDRAYFEANRIVVQEITEDENTGIESTRTLATIPYVEQMDMFRDLESILEKAVNNDHPDKTCIIDARVIKKVVDQLKDGDDRVYVKVRFKGELDPVILTAFDELDYKTLTAAVMPIKG